MPLVTDGPKIHRCALPEPGKPILKDGLPRMQWLFLTGAIWSCDDCGKLWQLVLATNQYRGGYSGGGRVWKPARRRERRQYRSGQLRAPAR